jgi:hypothetical protein
MPKSTQQLQTIRTEGALLPPDILQRIASLKVDGVRPADYHLPEGFRINDAITQSWDILKKHWKNFQETREQLSDTEHGTSVTNERWLLPLFKELEYGRLSTSSSPQIEDRSYPIERFYNHTPIHLIGCNLPMDRRTRGARGAATSSPHSMIQEFLNRSNQHQWGFLSNGRQLRILRDNVSLSRQAYIEFDLEGMMEGEVYGDFVLLWLLCHQSRVESERTDDCWLEKWSKLAREEGTRVLNNLRTGVTRAIELLGQGFIAHPHNDELRSKLQESGTLTKNDFYRQLLRIVYRLLFLFVAEDRRLLHPTDADEKACELYDTYYSTRRLREMAFKLRGSKHADLWHSLSLVFDGLNRDNGLPELGLPALGSFLWNPQKTADLLGPAQIVSAIPSTPDKGERAKVTGPSELQTSVFISNDDLLAAIRILAYVEQDRVLRDIDYRNLGTEEFGSVYESLLELHPTVHIEAKSFDLGTASGNERKTSGSYYTEDSLVQCLLDSALDPVIAERLKGLKGKEAEDAILNIKVCDPACGSGHFLIGAARRLARHLARIRTGESEPSPEDYQHALRDVIGRCIYGVDINPMSVELCKVALWMEAMEPGKPLSFLDHHILCGNSLLGTTPRLLSDGIPDDAFSPIEGDVKAVVNSLKAQNKKERQEYKKGQGYLFEPFVKLGNLPSEFSKLSRSSDDSVADVAEKERRYAELVSGADYQNARLLADTWCAVFVWQKDTSGLGKLCPTERDFRKIENNPHSILPHVKSEVRRLGNQYQFFHWHLVFPDVFRLPDGSSRPENAKTGWNSGFDVVLGNPPWDMQEVKDNEFFAVSYPSILSVKSAKDKKGVLERIQRDDPLLWKAYTDYVRETHGQKHFMLNSNLYPLAGTGRLNLYRVFLETDHNIVATTGQVGVVIPSGFASDSFSQTHFTSLHEAGRIRSLYDFENREGLFPGVHKSYKFCLLTVGSERLGDVPTDFVFFAHNVSVLADKDRHVALSPSDLATLNPLTRTSPLFKSFQDQLLTLFLHHMNPIVADDDKNGWQISPILMFMMNASMEHHRSADELESDGYYLEMNYFSNGPSKWYPLYEGKMVTAYDHRASSIKFDPTNRVRRNQPVEITPEEHGDPHIYALPVFWVEESEVVNRCGLVPRWCPVIKDVTSSTNVRTSIAALLPASALTDSVPFIRNPQSATRNGCLIAVLNAFVFDFVARQKVAGLHLRGHYLAQLPLISIQRLALECPWDPSTTVEAFIASRVLELTYTAWDMEAFAIDCGYQGPPFRWDEERRFMLRCELDAAIFHLYLGSPEEWGNNSSKLCEMIPAPRDAVDYIMETFPIAKRRDISRTEVLDQQGEVATEGCYTTKETILGIYDELQVAIDTGSPYRTRIDPQPGPPTDANGNFIPASAWETDGWPSHIHLACGESSV